MRDQRKLNKPQHLELLHFLRCNKFLWNEVTIDDIIVIVFFTLAELSQWERTAYHCC